MIAEESIDFDVRRGSVDDKRGSIIAKLGELDDLKEFFRIHDLHWPTHHLHSFYLSNDVIHEILDSLTGLVVKENCQCNFDLIKSLFHEVHIESKMINLLTETDELNDTDKKWIKLRIDVLNEDQRIMFLMGLVMKNLNYALMDEMSMTEIQSILDGLLDYICRGN